MALFDDPMNIIFSLIVTFLPLIIIFFPYLYTRKKDENLIAVIFNRFYIGFIVFYIGYFVFPSIINSFVPNPNQYMTQEYYPIPGTNGFSTVWDTTVSPANATIPGVPIIIRYLVQHLINSLVNYLNYPIIVLGFVFGISPFLSMIIILYQTWGEKRNNKKPLKRFIKRNQSEIKVLKKQLKKASEEKAQEIALNIKEIETDTEDLKQQLNEVRGITQRLQEIQFEMEVSPFQEIMTRVKKKNWDSERELLKVLIAILPITLFLLMTILQLLGETENPSLLQGTTMGWFLEIFFAYIASIVFCVYLIKASHLSRKGKFLGNQLYITMVQSLSTVGAFMSGLAVILFLVQYSDQIFVISYFVVYFIMVSIFFVLFLDIFEPFSIYLLLKLIESFKNLRVVFEQFDLKNYAKSALVGIVFGILLAFGFLTYRVFMKGMFIYIETVHYKSFFWLTQNFASFILCALLILFIRRWNWSLIGSTVTIYITMFLVSFLIFNYYTDQWYTLLGFAEGDPFPHYEGQTLIAPFITVVANLFAGITGTSVTSHWLSSIWKEGTFNQIQFIVPQLTQIPVIWKGTGGQFLGILSIPYNVLHPFAILMTYGAVLFLARRKFQAKTQIGKEKTQYKTIYSDMAHLPSKSEMERKSKIILISASQIEEASLKQQIDEKVANIENGSQLYQAVVSKERSLEELNLETGLKTTRIQEILDELTFDLEVPFNQIFTLLHKEFSYSFKEVTIDSLHVMMLDGRALLSHTFAAESLVEPALVAGLFSAITSFAKEAVRSEQLLKTIDHGDVVLTIEYAKHVFAAIFADSTSTELRKKLTSFLTDFEKRHGKTLPMWLGDLEVFYGDIQIVKEVFTAD